MIKIPSKDLYKKYFEKNLQEKEKKYFYDHDKDTNLKFNLENIKSCISPDDFDDKKNIIVIGEVQSGKTNNLIALADLVAQENIYDHIIWLSGTNRNLATQTFLRYSNDTTSQFYSEKIYFYDSNIKKNNLSFLIDNLSSKKVVIALVMKESSHLKKIKKCFEIANTYGKKILIIDDECDFFSIENKKDSESSQRISTMIKEIKDNNNYSKALYVGVTATPYSNFNFELNKKLFPDQAILLNTNYKQYTGINWFNKYSKDLYTITEDFKNNFNYNHSLKLGIVSFVHSHLIRKTENKYAELLINIDLDNENQKIIRTEFNQIIETWNSKIFLNFDEFQKEIMNLAKELKLTSFNFEEFVEEIKKFKNNFNLYLLNSDKSDPGTISTYNSKNESCVIIGGVMVSRGFTFENLTTEIMLNSPKEKIKIDVLLQRARWFGYRRSMKSYIRVIMNQKLVDAFMEAEVASEILKNFFKDNWVTDNITELYAEIKMKSNSFGFTEVL